MLKKVTLSLALLLLLLTVQAWGDAPNRMNFQGRLTDPAGNALTGVYSIRFSIWTASAGGTELWFETQPAVSVSNGLFNVELGSVDSIDDSVLFQTEFRYLEIKVGADPPLSPRQRLSSAPFAFSLENEPGLAYNWANTVSSLSNTTGTYLTRSITTQTDGYVIVTATGFFLIDPAATGNKVAARASISTTLDAFDFFNMVIWGAPDWPSTGSEYYSSWSITRVFTVGPGTHTYYLTANKYLGTADIAELYRPSLTLLFVPEAKGTVTTLSAQSGAEANFLPDDQTTATGVLTPVNKREERYQPEGEEK